MLIRGSLWEVDSLCEDLEYSRGVWWTLCCKVGSSMYSGTKFDENAGWTALSVKIWINDSNPSKIFNFQLVVHIWTDNRFSSDVAQIQLTNPYYRSISKIFKFRIGLGAFLVERSFFPENERNDQEQSHRSEKKRTLSIWTISKRKEWNRAGIAWKERLKLFMRSYYQECSWECIVTEGYFCNQSSMSHKKAI